MTTEGPEEPNKPLAPDNSTGRLVVQYLQENEYGGTAKEIIQHLQAELKNEHKDLDKVVQCILENGTALGFLERKGSHYMNWIARHPCGRKRRLRSCSRRRTRRIRRKRSCCCRQRGRLRRC